MKSRQFAGVLLLIVTFLFGRSSYPDRLTSVPAIVGTAGLIFQASGFYICLIISIGDGRRRTVHEKRRRPNKRYPILFDTVIYKLLQEITDFMSNYYNGVRLSVKEDTPQNDVSMTLITKVLMGALGCVPAYDRYFIAGIKNEKVSTGNYNIKSVIKLVDFYEANFDKLEKARNGMTIDGIPYPQMKMLDMGFWQIGFEMDTEKGLQKAH